jgi:dihydroorotate dehydrogenase
MLYRMLFRVIFARVDAERAHHIGFALIRLAGAIPPVLWILRRLLAPADPVLRVHALGLELPGPLGLAAGFDKNARAPEALAALGFGFVEVGTLTAQPQPGNPKPRLFRLTADGALINRMGFNNDGSSAAAQRLSPRKTRKTLIGVNIGKSKVATDDEAIGDYVTSTAALARVADYLVVNVSSPNTPGLRALQAVDQLRPLLTAVRDALDDQCEHRVPLLVKIAPDLADEDIDDIAGLALELGLDGIIATNTTIGRAGLTTPDSEVVACGPGGLSGPVLRERSLEVLRRLRKRTGDELVLISAGGISTGHDAWERIEAGATLVQAYTGFIYGGPFWPARVHRDLARRTRAAGLATIQQAIGTRA